MSAPPRGRTRPCAAAAQQTPCQPTQCAPEMPRPKQPRNSPSSPKKKKGPPETTTLVTRRSVWGESEAGRCAFGLCGEARGSRAGRHNTQTTPICVVKPVSQQNGQRLNALLILAFFVFFGGWYSLQIKIYYLTFNLYRPFVTTEHYRSTHRPHPCYAGGTSPL